jgi:hypothetical protein
MTKRENQNKHTGINTQEKAEGEKGKKQQHARQARVAVRY